jgi:hypothetical protein
MMKRDKTFEGWLCKQQGILPKSALRYTLEAFVPYTEANTLLAFKPSIFFNELERIDPQKYSRATVRKAYYEARRRRLITMNDDGVPIVSEEAKRQIRPYKPKRLKRAKIMVIFDIPELESQKRRWFRLLLRELKFEQVQKSVWQSEYDCAEILSAGILEQRIEKYVRVYEARPIEQ